MPRRSSSAAVAGVAGPLRDQAVAAAEQAGLSLEKWIEQALRLALEAKAEPAPPVGVELGELEAMVRRVVAEELRPLKEALARPEATAPPSRPVDSSPVGLMRERRRQSRSR